jgi:hypothetical protein
MSELHDLDREKQALDSDPIRPGNQIESIYEPTRAERRRGNAEVAAFFGGIVLFIVVFGLVMCKAIGVPL